MNHTPGPWKIETVDTSVGICHKIGPFPTRLASRPYTWACVYVDGMPRGHGVEAEVLHANARLIAAAPDLLGALEALLIFHQSAKNHPLHAEARKAVANAKGEA